MPDNTSNRVLKRWEYVALAVATGVACLLFASTGVWIDLNSAKLNFQQQADTVQSDLAQRVRAAHGIADAVVAFHYASEDVRPHELATMSRELLRSYEHIRLVLRLAAVPAAGRNAFEGGLRDNGFPQFHISERDPQRRFVAAGKRETYLAVESLAPLEPRHAGLLGYDFASDPAMANAIRRAVDTAAVAAEVVPSLLHDGLDYVAFKAVYRGNSPPNSVAARRAQLRYVIAVVVGARTLLASDVVAPHFRVSLHHMTAGGRGHEISLLNETADAPTDIVATLLPAFRLLRALRIDGETFALGVTSHPHSRDLRLWLLALLVLLPGVAGVLMATVLRIRRLGIHELREREHQLRQIIDLVPHMIYAKDREGNILLANLAVAETYGVSIEDLVGNPPPTTIMDEFDLQMSQEDDDEVLRNGKPVTGVDELIVHATKGSRHLETTKIPFATAELDELGVLAVSIDMTEQRRAAQALLENEERFRDYAEVTSDWFWAMDAALRFTYLSDRFEDLTGVPPDRVIGKTREQLLERSHIDDQMRGHLEDLEARRPFRAFRYSFSTPDGKPCWFSTSGKPIYDADGVFIGYRGTGSEITAEIEAQLTLEEAKDAAERANKGKSEFLANMSHELLTPLNAVIGFSDLIKEQALGAVGNDDYVEYATHINESGARLLALINDVLDLAKIEAGRLPLMESEVELSDMLTMCGEAGRVDAENAGQTFSLDLQPGLPLIIADERKLRQVISNLLANAIKFTPEGGTIGLSAAVDDRGVAIRVSDNGIGMSEEEVAVAMQAFRQVDGALSRKFEGSGLGLPLSKALVGLHDGELTVDSLAGVSTTVTIALPASRIVAHSALVIDSVASTAVR